MYFFQSVKMKSYAPCLRNFTTVKFSHFWLDITLIMKVSISLGQTGHSVRLIKECLQNFERRASLRWQENHFKTSKKVAGSVINIKCIYILRRAEEVPFDFWKKRETVSAASCPKMFRGLSRLLLKAYQELLSERKGAVR